jgi:hypothetical protein
MRLRASVGNSKRRIAKSDEFWEEVGIFPLVVGRESDRRKRRKLLTIESGFPKAKDRAKQIKAGTAKVGGQR